MAVNAIPGIFCVGGGWDAMRVARAEGTSLRGGGNQRGLGAMRVWTR